MPPLRAIAVTVKLDTALALRLIGMLEAIPLPIRRVIPASLVVWLVMRTIRCEITS